MHSSGPFRPVVLSPGSDVLDAARVAAAAAAAATATCLPPNQNSVNSNVSSFSGLNSSFTGFALPNTTVYPEIALFSQFGQLFPQYTDLGQNQSQHGQPPQSQATQQHSPPHISFLQQQPNQPSQHKPTLSGLSGLSGLTDDNRTLGSRGKTRSSDSRSSSAYASRHQAAEQRRRTRINERLELLRRMVPHAERANTACFLEEVIKYIDTLKRRNTELEGALQKLLPAADQDASKAEAERAAQASPAKSHDASARAEDANPLDAQQQSQKDIATAEVPGNDLAAVEVAGSKVDATSTIQSLLAGYTAINNGAPRKSTSQSPASSEESGVPFKKRKMLVL